MVNGVLTLLLTLNMWNKIKTFFRKAWKWLVGITIGSLAFAQVAGFPPETPATITEIEVMQDAYFAKHGKYLQVTRNNKPPHYTTDKLSKKIPNNMVVNIYETPEGEWGYQIITYNEDRTVISIGFGPQAAKRTYQIFNPDDFIE